MRRLQSGIALLCVLMLLAPAANAQLPVVQKKNGGFFRAFTNQYQWEEVAPVNLSNSSRLESLVRAGNLYLSLQDAIALGLENNLDIQLQRYTPLNAEYSLLRAQAGGVLRGIQTSISSVSTNALNQLTGGLGGGTSSSGRSSGSSTGGTILTATGTAIPDLDPSFYVAGQLGHTTSPFANTVGSGVFSATQDTRVLNYGVSKGFLTGTSVSFGMENTRAATNSPNSQLNPFVDGSARVTISQNLLRGFGLAVNNRNIRIARNNIKVADLTFKQQVIATVSAIISGYWDLVSFNENVRVRRQALALAQKLYDDNKKQVEIGTLAPIEIVRAEAEVASAQQQLVNAETNLLQQEVSMKNALSRTGVASPSIADVRIIPTDRIQVPAQEAIVPVQDLVTQAMESRPELASSTLNIESSRIGLAGSRSQLLPSLGIQASFTNNALAGTPRLGASPDPILVGGWGTALGQIFRRNFPDYSIAFQLSVPIRNRAAKGDMVMDQISLRQNEIRHQQLLNDVRVGVRNALIALQQASAAYQASVKARVLQEQTLDAEQKKYQLGASTVFLVIQAQRDLAQARSQEVSAESQYAKAKVNLDMAVGRTLNTNNISLDEALQGRVSKPPSALPAMPQQ